MVAVIGAGIGFVCFGGSIWVMRKKGDRTSQGSAEILDS
jgi:hypothetical protein